ARPVLRVRKAGAVRSRVVAIARRQRAAGEERILRGRARQPPHVVKRELVGARGIGHLGQPRVVIVGIIHRRGIRIRLLGQPVQLVYPETRRVVSVNCSSATQEPTLKNRGAPKTVRDLCDRATLTSMISTSHYRRCTRWRRRSLVLPLLGQSAFPWCLLSKPSEGQETSCGLAGCRPDPPHGPTLFDLRCSHDI